MIIILPSTHLYVMYVARAGSEEVRSVTGTLLHQYSEVCTQLPEQVRILSNVFHFDFTSEAKLNVFTSRAQYSIAAGLIM